MIQSKNRRKSWQTQRRHTQPPAGLHNVPVICSRMLESFQPRLSQSCLPQQWLLQAMINDGIQINNPMPERVFILRANELQLVQDIYGREYL